MGIFYTKLTILLLFLISINALSKNKYKKFQRQDSDASTQTESSGSDETTQTESSDSDQSAQTDSQDSSQPQKPNIQPSCNDGDANIAIQKIRNFGVSYINQIENKHKNIQSISYFNDDNDEKLEFPQYCFDKLHLDEEIGTLAQKGETLIALWRAALGVDVADAPSYNLPCLNADQLLTFYQSTIDGGLTNGKKKNTFSEGKKFDGTDLIKKILWDDNSTRTEISWLEYWVNQCAKDEKPEPEEYSDDLQNRRQEMILGYFKRIIAARQQQKKNEHEVDVSGIRRRILTRVTSNDQLLDTCDETQHSNKHGQKDGVIIIPMNQDIQDRKDQTSSKGSKASEQDASASEETASESEETASASEETASESEEKKDDTAAADPPAVKKQRNAKKKSSQKQKTQHKSNKSQDKQKFKQNNLKKRHLVNKKLNKQLNKKRKNRK